MWFEKTQIVIRKLEIIQFEAIRSLFAFEEKRILTSDLVWIYSLIVLNFTALVKCFLFSLGFISQQKPTL